MAINQTTTVQKMMDWCSMPTSLENYFRSAGQNNEPAMTICNTMLQMLLARPMSWTFNRNVGTVEQLL